MRKRATVLAVSLALLLLLSACADSGEDSAPIPSADSSTASASQAESEPETGGTAASGEWEHVTPEDSLQSVINHPAFGDFGEKLLPWVGERNNIEIPLGQASSLMPYHSNVNPGDMAAALNTMIDDAAAGQTIYYNYYSEEELQADPGKQATGMFFYRGEPGAPFAVISAGGGGSYVASLHEGFPYAMKIREAGYNAFVIKYRTNGGGANDDLAAAISYIYENADELGVSREGYSVWGSSAGARMAAYIGSHGTAAFGGDDIPKPGTVVMLYTSHTDLGDIEPPTFAAISADDHIASPSTMQQRINAIDAMGVDTEFILYQNASHGFGLGTGTDAEGWIDSAIGFWEEHFAQS